MTARRGFPRIRALRRALSSPASAAFALVAAIGVGLAVLGLFGLDGGSGGFESVLALDPIPGGWPAGFPAPDETAHEVEAARLDRLLGLVAGMSLLIAAMACLHATATLMGDAVSGRREAATRVALGATWIAEAIRSLVRVLPLLAVAGAAGLIAGPAGGARLAGSWPHEVAPVSGRGLTRFAVLTALAGAPLLLALAAAILPAASRARLRNLLPLLSTGRHATPDRHEGFVGRAVVVVQFAGAASLLVGAGLLLRSGLPGSAGARGTAGPGELADATDVVRFHLSPDREATIELYRTLLSRLESIPGVERVSLASPGTSVGMGSMRQMSFWCGECRVGVWDLPLQAEYPRHHFVAPDTFDLLGIDIVEGRGIGPDDAGASSNVAVVNRAFARRFEEGRPLGREVLPRGTLFGGYRVVGVVDDGALGAASEMPAIYLPLFHAAPRSVEVTVRLESERHLDPRDAIPDPERTDSTLVATAAVAVPGARITTPTSLGEWARYRAAPYRWVGGTLGTLAALGLLLSLQGLREGLRGQVDRRRREFGTRMALGARGPRIYGSVVATAGRIVLWGAFYGALLSILVAHLTSTLVPDVRLFDPALFGAIVTILAAGALFGGLSGSRAAVRLEPMEALRDG